MQALLFGRHRQTVQLPSSNRTVDTIHRRDRWLADNLYGNYCSEQYCKQEKLYSTFHRNYVHHLVAHRGPIRERCDAQLAIEVI
jgi:hypothetical protein